MLLLNAFLQGDVWVVLFGNIIQKKGKKQFCESEAYSRHFFWTFVKTILVDFMFIIDRETSSPVFCKELYTRSPIKLSVSIDFDLPFCVNPCLVTYLILNIYQKQIGRKKSTGKKDP